MPLQSCAARRSFVFSPISSFPTPDVAHIPDEWYIVGLFAEAHLASGPLFPARACGGLTGPARLRDLSSELERLLCLARLLFSRSFNRFCSQIFTLIFACCGTSVLDLPSSFFFRLLQPGRAQHDFSKPGRCFLPRVPLGGLPYWWQGPHGFLGRTPATSAVLGPWTSCLFRVRGRWGLLWCGWLRYRRLRARLRVNMRWFRGLRCFERLLRSSLRRHPLWWAELRKHRPCLLPRPLLWCHCWPGLCFWLLLRSKHAPFLGHFRSIAFYNNEPPCWWTGQIRRA